MTQALENNVTDREELYDAVLNNRLSLNKGMFFENMVAQELRILDKGLAFTKFYTDESKRIQEVDFLIAKG